ncbi:MAG: AMP-binding protein [Pseudomonadales bacterium]
MTAEATGPPGSLPALFARSVERWPQSPAVRAGEKELNYRQLQEEVQHLARGLRGLGVVSGDRVAVFLPKRIETVVSMLAVLAADAVLVPVNPALKPAQVEHILRNCTPRVLITLEDRAGGLAHYLDSEAPGPVVVRVDSPSGPERRDGNAWVALNRTGTGGEENFQLASPLAALLYTSGTTGLPKGVMVSHSNLAFGVDSVVTYLGIDHTDRILCSLPFSFDYGLNQLLSAVAVGACAVLLDYFHAQQVLRTVESERITALAGVPTMWVQLAAQEWPRDVARSLRYITNSGDRLPPRTLAILRDRLPDARIFLMYGFTEAFRGAFLDPQLLDTHADSIGKPVPHSQFDIIDDSGESLPPGEVGELVQRGPLVTCGYWQDAMKTGAKFAPTKSDGLHADWVRSGDLAWRDEDGFYYFMGRVDHLIKTAGYRVSRTEVEEVLHSSGLVLDAAVVGRPHPVWGSQVIAFVSAPAGGTVDVEALLQHCRRNLPRYMVPNQVGLLAEVPKTANAKIDYESLRDRHCD